MLIVPAMDLTTILSLAAAAFIFGISPGPGTLAALSVSTADGLKSGLILGAGEAVGDVVYLSFAILSLGYLAEHLEPIMNVVRWVGAGYLVFLGITQFRLQKLNLEKKSLGSKNLIKQFFIGFLIGGTNPKVIIFYLSFIPLFLDLSNINLNNFALGDKNELKTFNIFKKNDTSSFLKITNSKWLNVRSKQLGIKNDEFLKEKIKGDPDLNDEIVSRIKEKIDEKEDIKASAGQKKSLQKKINQAAKNLNSAADCTSISGLAIEGIQDKINQSFLENLKHQGKQFEILLGLSGGLDSSVLLFLLAKMQVKFSFNLKAIHIHHGLNSLADNNSASSP